MTDTHNIDGHKLIYHPRRVANWLEGRDKWESARDIYPIYVEIAPIGACNHRCTFCSVDYIGYQNRSQDTKNLKDTLSEMASLGVRSVMFAGEGEPVLWKPLPEIVAHCSTIGIDTSLTTNLIPFTAANTEAFVANCSWIKASINAGTRTTYSRIHQTKEDDFDRAIANLKRAVETRQRLGKGATIGAQILLLPENANEVELLARTLCDVGADYLVVKSYTQSLAGLSHRYEGLDYAQFQHLGETLELLNTQTFKVIFRKRSMAKLGEAERPYQRCNATPFFWAYIMADGSVYGCGAYLQDDRFNYGNINDKSFKDIWQGDKRRAAIDYVRNQLDIRECRRNCRMDDVNRYLMQLESPDPHVNFI